MTPGKLSKDIRVTVVIVDDSPSEHFFIKEALKDYKNVLFNDYYNGEDFLHFLEQKSKQPHPTKALPDIVILDVNMPKMTGFEVFDLVESKGLKGYIKFYILTTSVTEAESVNCKKYQLKCYEKPFNPHHFTELLEDMIIESRQE